jgi:hypothetical protein
MSEPISKSNGLVSLELRNSLEEEELKDSALSMTMKTLIERSSLPPDSRELILRRSLLKIERNPERKKEERSKRLRNIKVNVRLVLREDKRKI